MPYGACELMFLGAAAAAVIARIEHTGIKNAVHCSGPLSNITGKLPDWPHCPPWQRRGHQFQIDASPSQTKERTFQTTHTDPMSHCVQTGILLSSHH